MEYDLRGGGCSSAGSGSVSRSDTSSRSSRSSSDKGSEEDESDEEAEDVPEELRQLSPEEQQKRIKIRAAWMCSLGTFMVVVFSDPMVDVLSVLAKRIDVPPFFVSFILSPLVSNASELIAAYNYAKKKTIKSATTSLSTLQGAACLNNTLCLSAFLFVVYVGQLKWAFTLETANVVIIELIMAALIYSKRVHTIFEATCVLSLFPWSLVFVWVGTRVLGVS